MSMTENEAIKKIINENTQIAIGNLTAIKLICKKFENAEETIDMAIQVLEKVQQFESIGTIEEFKALKENESKCKDCAGCTLWKCDCANERDYAITQFANFYTKKQRKITDYV